MECRVKSVSKVTTIWYKETTVIKESTRVKSTIISEGNEEYTIKLDIKVKAIIILITVNSKMKFFVSLEPIRRGWRSL